MIKMSMIRTISIEFECIRVWLTNALFGLRLPRIIVPAPSVRVGLGRPWFSASSANDFEIGQLARNEYYKSLARIPAAR